MAGETNVEVADSLEGSKIDQGKGDGEVTKPEAKPVVGDLEARLAASEAEKAEFKRVAEGAVREAEASKNYVTHLTSVLQSAAERPTPGASAEDPDAMRENVRERLSSDPLAVLNAHYEARTAPLVAAFSKTQANMNRELFVAKTDPKMWNKYANEVDKFMEPFPPETKSQPGAYEAALRWVRANHVDDEVAEREAERKETEKRSFVEGASAGGGVAKAKPSLSELQKQIAKGLGISEEDYTQYANET